MSDWRHELVTRLAGLRLPPEHELDIVEELSQHLDDRVRDLVAGGMAPDVARHSALADLDAPGELARRLGEIVSRPPLILPPPGTPSRGRWFQARWQDVRHALRSLRHAPAFTLAVVATLGLTIGPTTTMLSIGNWLLWRPTPGVVAPDRLAVAWFGIWRERGLTVSGVSYPNLEDLRRASKTLSAISGGQEGGSINVAAGDLPPSVMQSGWVTSDFFETLGVRVAAGRTFRLEDDRPPTGAHVVVISNTLARRAFGGVEAAINTRVTLNGRPMTVIGVLPPGFVGTEPLSRVDVWYPGSTYGYVNHFKEPRFATRADPLFYSFVVRLAPGATVVGAQAELDVLVPALAKSHPEENGDFERVRARLYEGLGPRIVERDRYRRLVRILLAVGGVLLLLGCANTANLLMVRGLRRRREHAVRLALGASRRRLVLLQLTETTVLAVGGAALGVALAWWLKQFVVSLIMPGLPAELSPIVPLDLRVLAMTLGVSVACGLAAGLVPAVLGTAGAGSPSSADLTGRSVTGTRRLRTGFAVVQLALSLALVTGALLLVATVRNLNAVDLGFDPDGVSVHRLDPTRHGYSAERSLAYYGDVLGRLQGTPGVQAIALGNRTPFGSGRRVRLQHPSGRDGERVEVLANAVSSGYFNLLGIPILKGRSFSESEAMAAPGGPEATLINDSLAHRLFGAGDPLGRRIVAMRTEKDVQELTVIGVAQDSRWNTLTDDPELFLYLPFTSRQFGVGSASALIKSPLPLREVAARVTGVTRQIDPTLPVLFSMDLRVNLDQELGDRRVFAWVLSMLGWLGFALAAIGLYGLLAQSVAERTREFGIRMAVGGGHAHIFGLVLRQAAWIGMLGTAAGLGLAVFGSRIIESQLYGVTRLSPGIYVAAAAALAAVVFVAGFAPARTATRIDPVEALRTE